MQKVTLTKIWRGKQNTRYGEKDKVSIKTQENGDQWISTFNTKGTDSWNEGDNVIVVISRNGDFLNFRVPDRVDYLRHEVEKVKKFVGYKEERVEEEKKEETPPETDIDKF